MQYLIIVLVVVSAACYVNCDGELTSSDVNFILAQHNTARRAQGASNMYELAWDYDLESEMQALVDRCVWSHTPDAQRSWGENLGQMTFPKPEYMAYYNNEKKINILVTAGMPGFDSWILEQKYDINHDFACAFKRVDGQTCGHYTQVVWAASTLLGCAATNCMTFTSNVSPLMTSENVWMLACAYRKPGNMQGESAYVTGTACSACADGDSCQNDLCIAA